MDLVPFDEEITFYSLTPNSGIALTFHFNAFEGLVDLFMLFSFDSVSS